MKLYLILMIVIFVVFAMAQSKISDEFPSISEQCMRRLEIPQRYRVAFQTFQYPNETVVHKYIHCVASDLEIWDNSNGFNAEKIYQHYRTKANEELVLPVISNCNRNNENRNKELWCYRAYLCILNTQVGTWFKEDVKRKQEQRLPNGH